MLTIHAIDLMLGYLPYTGVVRDRGLLNSNDWMDFQLMSGTLAPSQLTSVWWYKRQCSGPLCQRWKISISQYSHCMVIPPHSALVFNTHKS